MVKGTFWVGRVRWGKGVGASAAGLQKVGPPMKNDMWNVKISIYDISLKKQPENDLPRCKLGIQNPQKFKKKKKVKN